MTDKPTRVCSIGDCERKHFARSYCHAHYERFLKHGDPLGGRIMRGEHRRYYEEVVLPYEGEECFPWPYTLDSNGYPRLTEGRKSTSLHRKLCRDFRGDPPTDLHQAAHCCGNRDCLNKRHIRWKTQRENEADKVVHGTALRGETHNRAKLRDDQVREIRMLRGIETQPALAKRFGVTKSQIGKIQRREFWRHLP